DTLRLATRSPGARERLRMLRLAARAFLTVASRQPGPLGKLIPTPAVRQRELQPERGAPTLLVRTDDMVLMEVYGGRPYDLDYGPIGEVSSILDLGANAGMASAFLGRRFPGAKIVAVEPNPSTFELLTQNLRRIATDAIAVNAAIVPAGGSYRIEPGSSPSNAQVVSEVDEIDRSGGFETLTLGELIDRYLPTEGVDLMKVDIEGGERELFERVSEWAPRVKAIVAETHLPLTSRGAYALLAGGGFKPLPVPGGQGPSPIIFCMRNA
ncbi:MAG: hypothetical protein QOE50_1225, partial [Sphingomonadales bacterium]|nr:hypothetical protein [Sphingomonadales bacterium]